MNARTIWHSPTRAAAWLQSPDGLSAARGSVAGSQCTHAVAARRRQDTPVASAADADTLSHYLGTLRPADRAQTIVAVNPNARGALAAIETGDLASRQGSR